MSAVEPLRVLAVEILDSGRELRLCRVEDEVDMVGILGQVDRRRDVRQPLSLRSVEADRGGSYAARTGDLSKEAKCRQSRTTSRTRKNETD